MTDRDDDTWARLIERGKVRAAELVEMAGGLLSAREVSAHTGIPPEEIETRVAAGELIAMRENGTLLFPACQFTSTGVVENLSIVLKDDRTQSPWVRLEWFLVPDDALLGLSPLEALKQGQVEEVARLARANGAD